MAIILGYIDIGLAFIFLYLILQRWLDRNAPIRNWPVIGMVPGLLHNARRMHDFATDCLRQAGWTYNVKGPWLAGMDFVITSDPMNIHYICSRNFGNYPKGREFNEIFEALGDGIFNADGEMWKVQRKVLHSLIKNENYEAALVKTINRKVENGLFPILNHASELKTTLDLQEVFQRFTFDNICKLVLGFDPGSLSVGFPPNEYEKAYSEMEEAVFYRQIVPESCWKLQKWLQVGEEKKFRVAYETFYKFLHDCISVKGERLSRRTKADDEEKKEEFDLLTALLEEEETIEDGLKNSGFTMTDELLRDISFNLIGAGRDTISSGLTWFFWLIATHPSVESRILAEITSNFQKKGDTERLIGSAGELKKFIYLHATLCETLRLYPPVPINHKTAAKADVLPSGHFVKRNERVLLSFYSMARMEEIWGEDCLEFKPERWISKREGFVHVPSYKFVAFHAGPRNCLGKDQSFIQMKMAAIVIIKNYHVQVVEDHPISTSDSIVLHMKYGLKVRISKRKT